MISSLAFDASSQYLRSKNMFCAFTTFKCLNFVTISRKVCIHENVLTAAFDVMFLQPNHQTESTFGFISIIPPWISAVRQFLFVSGGCNYLLWPEPSGWGISFHQCQCLLQRLGVTTIKTCWSKSFSLYSSSCVYFIPFCSQSFLMIMLIDASR